MWIMLIKKLPTEVSPPKLSIFWSVPWPDEIVVQRQFERIGRDDELLDKHPEYLRLFGYDEKGNKIDPEKLKLKVQAYMEQNPDVIYDELFGYGGDPNWAKARAIMYKKEKIRVFSHEYSVLTHQNMDMYINESHELVPDTVAESSVLESLLDGDLREVYDAALVDGCSHSQAIGVAFGVNIEEVEPFDLAKFPPVGWYRCKQEYALYYCDENELEE